MPRIFVCREIPKPGLDLLKNTFGADAVDMYPKNEMIPREALLEGVKGADAILPILTDKMDAEVMDSAGPQLKIIANFAVGYNNVDVAAATQRGIPVTNTPGVLTETTADLTWAILMAVARRLGEGERLVRAGKWDGWGPMQLMGTDIYGKTLGIFGMGRIGQAVAKRAQGFDMRVICYTRNGIDSATSKALGATEVDLDTLLAESDYLTLHCPLTPETTHAFGAPEFKKMKSSAILVNTSRGPVIDEAALVDALRNGDIAAAALDVFEAEPKLQPGLVELENVLLIPHLGSATHDTRGKMALMAAQNIVARLAGQTPPNCVNPEVL